MEAHHHQEDKCYQNKWIRSISDIVWREEEHTLENPLKILLALIVPMYVRLHQIFHHSNENHPKNAKQWSKLKLVDEVDLLAKYVANIFYCRTNFDMAWRSLHGIHIMGAGNKLRTRKLLVHLCYPHFSGKTKKRHICHRSSI